MDLAGCGWGETQQQHDERQRKSHARVHALVPGLETGMERPASVDEDRDSVDVVAGEPSGGVDGIGKTPAFPSSMAMALPLPELAPVTMAVCPSSKRRTAILGVTGCGKRAWWRWCMMNKCSVG